MEKKIKSFIINDFFQNYTCSLTSEEVIKNVPNFEKKSTSLRRNFFLLQLRQLLTVLIIGIISSFTVIRVVEYVIKLDNVDKVQKKVLTEEEINLIVSENYEYIEEPTLTITIDRNIELYLFSYYLRSDNSQYALYYKVIYYEEKDTPFIVMTSEESVNISLDNSFGKLLTCEKEGEIKEITISIVYENKCKKYVFPI